MSLHPLDSCILASERGFDEIDDGGPASSPKRVAMPAMASYAQKTAGGVGEAAVMGQSVIMDKSWLDNGDPLISNEVPYQAILAAIVSVSSESDTSLGLSEEMANLSGLLEKDSSPLNMALLIFLNKSGH